MLQNGVKQGKSFKSSTIFIKPSMVAAYEI